MTLTPPIKQFCPDYANLANSFAEPFRSSRSAPRIAVIGDFCLDKYLYVYPALEEKSVETGLPAHQARDKRLFAGVGGTIANNLRALGAETFCFGVIGDDGEGYELMKALRNIGANVDGMIVSSEVVTGTYMKPMFLQDALKSQAQLITPMEGTWKEGARIDLRNPEPINSEIVEKLQHSFLENLKAFDAVIVSDQFSVGSEALFSHQFRQFISQTAANNPDTFFLCDSRFFINDYKNVIVKCNADEALDAYNAAQINAQNRATNVRSDNDIDERELIRAGRRLAIHNQRPVLITRGSRGALLFNPIGSQESEVSVDITSIPPVRVSEPIDICGAGDATNAGFAFSIATGLQLTDSAFIAGIVSSITIKQIGVTGTASQAEIVETLNRLKSKTPSNKTAE